MLRCPRFLFRWIREFLDWNRFLVQFFRFTFVACPPFSLKAMCARSGLSFELHMLLETLCVYRYHCDNILKTLRQFLSEATIIFRSPLNIRESCDTSESKVKELIVLT